MVTNSPREQKCHNGGDVLNSPSASDQEGEYVVEKIIAQSGPKDGAFDEDAYLVRWEGYPDEQCTWEPRESFLSKDTLEQWELDKEREQTLSRDQVNEILRKMDTYAEAQEERKKRRRARIEQLEKNGKSNPTASSAMNEMFAKSTQQELDDSRDLAGSRMSKHQSLRSHNFQEIGIQPRARRSSHRRQLRGPRGEFGMHFKTLSAQYRNQKAGRNEPAPDIAKIKLKSATDIVAAAGEDIAHILPAGEWKRTPPFGADSRSTQVLSEHADKLGAVQAMPSSAFQTPLAPAALQLGSHSLKAQYVPSAPARAVSALANTQRLDVHHLPTGRYWLHGEILIHLTLLGVVVGDVRFGGLPPWFRTKMIALKVEHQVLVDFQLVEMRQYDALCRGRSNDLFAHAYITPFEDTGAALTELAESLAYNNRAALWYHPDLQHVLVAYAAMSNDWLFLDRGHTFPPECQVHLALRNTMPKIETLAVIPASEGEALLATSGKNTARAQMRPTPPNSPMQGVNLAASDDMGSYRAEQDVSARDVLPETGSRAISSSHRNPAQPRHSEPVATAVVNEFHHIELFHIKDSTSPGLTDSRTESDDDYSGSSPESAGRPLSPFSFTVPSGESIDTAFQTRFGIDYDLLTRPSVIPTSRRETLEPTRSRFYLAFPLACQAEMEALRVFLSTHTLPNLICTSADSQGWDGFKTILGDKMDHRGVIIFHTNFTNYSGLAGLAKLLKMANVNIFNLCLRQVLPYCDSPVNIERLFPNGTAVLLTESSMTQQPERILAILRWFSETAKTKRGTWKIVLIPNVRHWLRQTAMQPGIKQTCFLDILTEVSELSLGQPVTYRSLPNEESDAESLDGCDDEFGKPGLVVSPAHIAAYDWFDEGGNLSTGFERDRVLVEWFAGWAAQNAQRHRKFAAISAIPFSHESDRWGHIEVVDPNKYMLQNKIPFERQEPKDPPNQSPSLAFEVAT